MGDPYNLPPQYEVVRRHYPAFVNIECDIEKTLLSYIKPGMVILDGGCGAGNAIITECLKQADFKVVGVDCNAAALKKNSTYHELHVCDLKKISFKTDAFDIITSFFVMEHLQNPRKVLAEFARLLKPGGILIVSMPNLYNPVMMGARFTPHFLHVLFHKMFSGINRPYRTYFRCNTLTSLDRELKRLGFSKKHSMRRGNWIMYKRWVPLLRLWIALDKLTNMPLLRFTKTNLCVTYTKLPAAAVKK